MNRNCKKTKWALIASSILSEPLIFFYALLVPIFIKELNATGLQIAVLTTLHPITTFLSLYWSSFAARDPGKTKAFILLGGFISRALWLLILFINNVWLIIVIASLYTLFSKGTQPLWGELLRIRLEQNYRHRLFSVAASFAYLLALALMLTIGKVMPINGESWKSAFILSALIGMISLIFQMRIPVEKIRVKKEDKFNLWTPWKEVGQLLKKDKTFLYFQMRFMLFGVGVMMLHPVMNLYFVSVLQLDYMQISFLVTFCKGVGSVMSFRYWGKLLNSVEMPRFTSLIFTLFGVMILIATLAPIHIFFLIFAYLLRGTAQAGVHMVWNLSGPYYSQGGNSAIYSGVNLLMVGIRGLFAPGLGIALSTAFGTLPVLLLASGLCFASTFFFNRSEKGSFQEKKKVA